MTTDDAEWFEQLDEGQRREVLALVRDLALDVQDDTQLFRIMDVLTVDQRIQVIALHQMIQEAVDRAAAKKETR